MPGAGQGALVTSPGVSFTSHTTTEATGCSCILQMNMLRLLPLQLQTQLVSGVKEENEVGRAGLKARVITQQYQEIPL